ncbi:MAG: MFS transporter [Chloroflexi bacterium]|nr:MFS transporter [Chloroflexota bacterium]
MSRTRRPSSYAALAAVSLGVFLAALDQTVVMTALPSMMADLHIPLSRLDQASWIVTGYLLGYTVAMPLMGRVSDVYGRFRIFALSLLLFMGGSALAALASNLTWLVVARLIQAVGGGATLPVAMAIVADALPQRRHPLALGLLGGLAEAGGVLGPLYGGVITQAWGWPWIFWINVPLDFAIIALLARFMPAAPRRRPASVDYWGGALLGSSLLCLALALTREGGQARPIYYTGPLLAGAALSFSLFLLRERQAKEPLFRLSLFKDLAGANATNLLVGAALILVLVNVPLMADTILGQPALEGGLRLMRLTLAMAVGAPLGGLLCRRFGYRATALLGLSLSSAGFYFMSRWGLDITDPGMSLHLALSGLGLGLVIAPVASSVMSTVAEGERGVAASLVTVMRMVGMMVGLAALSAWGMVRFQTLAGDVSVSALITGDPQAQAQLTEAALSLFREFFLAAMAICLLAFLPALGLRRR